MNTNLSNSRFLQYRVCYRVFIATSFRRSGMDSSSLCVCVCVCVCVCTRRTDSFPCLSYSRLYIFIRNWVMCHSCFQFISKSFSHIEVWRLRWSFNYFWAVEQAPLFLPNVKNVLGHCLGKMQNFIESQIFQLSDVLEECVNKRVCSWCLR
jgi:hypothetical protein